MENEAGNPGTEEVGAAKKEKSKPATMREMVMRLCAVGNFGMQCVNVVLHITTRGGFWPAGATKQVGAGMLYGSSAVGAANSPVVIYKERQLTNEDTFRTALNGIRDQQARLSLENDILSSEIDDLQSEVDRMKDVEAALQELASTQGTQLSELMDLIEENKEINQGMRAVLKSKNLEEIIGLVLDIDNDGSFTIREKEIDRLIIGMDLIDGISFDKTKIRQEVINCDGMVDEVISMIKSMINGGDDISCAILTEEPEVWLQRQSSIHGSAISDP